IRLRPEGRRRLRVRRRHGLPRPSPRGLRHERQLRHTIRRGALLFWYPGAGAPFPSKDPPMNAFPSRPVAVLLLCSTFAAAQKPGSPLINSMDDVKVTVPKEKGRAE